MNLSKRLQAVANMISEGMSVADVGTDHGYIPIYLLESGKSPKVLAMDINQGPLLRAKEHIEEHGLKERIETRQSDGVCNLQVGEFDCVVIAGMGGALIIKILEEGQDVFRHLKEFILQPQSELVKVRNYLFNHGYLIVAEDMVLEDGKFYPVMKVISGESSAYTNVELRYGKCLLEQKHPVLRKFLEKEARKREMMIQNMSAEEGVRIQVRMKEIQEELEEIRYALQGYYEGD